MIYKSKYIVASCVFCFLTKGSRNLEKTKKQNTKDLATSPEIRVVAKTLFFSFCFLDFFVFSRFFSF